MFKPILPLFFLIVLAVLDTLPAAHTEDMQDILHATDKFRLRSDEVQVNTRILLYKNGVLDK